MLRKLLLLLLPTMFTSLLPAQETAPLRVGVVGLVHTHVHWILGREKMGDIEIVGIVEPNRDLAERYAEQHGYSMDIVFATMKEMVKETKPEAVTAFNTIYDHLQVVEFCAPRGIHVMVEKPLAVSWAHAQEMAKLARKHKIHLLTNYETTWYGTTEAAFQDAVTDGRIGPLRKMIFHTGHPGPIEIGCNVEFLEWLTDPVQNGGGALTDFGCYGANITNWFMQGQAPASVTCLTQNIKPELYPKVDDDALIILNYPQTQVIIQASWSWSHNRKDMEVYGTTGYLHALNGDEMMVQVNEKEGAKKQLAMPLPKNRFDPFAYLASVIRGKIDPQPYDLSALENNLMVMQILELAKKSAKEGKTMIWEEWY